MPKNKNVIFVSNVQVGHADSADKPSQVDTFFFWETGGTLFGFFLMKGLLSYRTGLILL
jgi:hypothetical protein